MSFFDITPLPWWIFSTRFSFTTPLLDPLNRARLYEYEWEVRRLLRRRSSPVVNVNLAGSYAGVHAEFMSIMDFIFFLKGTFVFWWMVISISIIYWAAIKVFFFITFYSFLLQSFLFCFGCEHLGWVEVKPQGHLTSTQFEFNCPVLLVSVHLSVTLPGQYYPVMCF